MSTPPTTTARTQPSGPFNGFSDGWGAKIAFNRRPSLQIWERKVKPYVADNGDPIDQSTNWNKQVLTFAPRILNKLDDITIEGGYDADCYSDIMNGLLGAEGSITVTWGSGDKLDFYGYLRKFEPSDLMQGDKPLATLTVTFTNRDSTGAEALPVYTAAAGT